jgi:N-acylneuraminate cytidylyltransferase
MANLCIIPARGGSKRIPMKNIKHFLGKPIIAYSIETAINSRLFDVVMVSTDDEEIAKVAAEYGVTAPFIRSKELANDFTSTFDVIEDIVNKYKDNSIDFENICCLYPCAPFITEVKLENAFKLMNEQNYDSVFPVIQYDYPIQRSLKKDNTGKINFLYPEYALTNSQDLEFYYHDA